MIDMAIIYPINKSFKTKSIKNIALHSKSIVFKDDDSKLINATAGIANIF